MKHDEDNNRMKQSIPNKKDVGTVYQRGQTKHLPIGFSLSYVNFLKKVRLNKAYG